MELNMSHERSDSSRLDALETLVAHQDRIVTELNDAVTAQWRKLDALERQVAKLLEEIQSAGAPRDASDPPPPHY
jgi:SlyX protein